MLARTPDGDQNPPWPPAPKPAATTSVCETCRGWIEGQVVPVRNATGIYQDLVWLFGFTDRYNSVNRFVQALKVREPERFDVLEALPVTFGSRSDWQAGVTSRYQLM